MAYHGTPCGTLLHGMCAMLCEVMARLESVLPPKPRPMMGGAGGCGPARTSAAGDGGDAKALGDAGPPRWGVASRWGAVREGTLA
jgi:hypothetical protein